MIELIYDEKEKVWKERTDRFEVEADTVYATIEVETKEDYEFIKEAIESRIEKLVSHTESHYMPSTYEYVNTEAECPSCGEKLVADEYYRPKFCWECGQALNWEDGE